MSASSTSVAVATDEQKLIGSFDKWLASQGGLTEQMLHTIQRRCLQLSKYNSTASAGADAKDVAFTKFLASPKVEITGDVKDSVLRSELIRVFMNSIGTKDEYSILTKSRMTALLKSFGVQAWSGPVDTATPSGAKPRTDTFYYGARIC